VGKQVDHPRNQAGPSSLVTGSESSTVVAVEVFVKEEMIASIGIALKFFGPTKNRSPAGFVA
jgi:hypothetical protein